MRILLYKPNTPDAFKVYSGENNIIVDRETQTVSIRRCDGEDTYKLVKQYAPVWTDDTKNVDEILVKLTVEEK